MQAKTDRLAPLIGSGLTPPSYRQKLIAALGSTIVARNVPGDAITRPHGPRPGGKRI
jgi:hypothetical protein